MLTRMYRSASGAAVILSLALAGPALPAPAADQPQWGQAWSRNMVAGERGLPDSFDPRTGRNVKWTARLGTETHATPVIARGRVFIGTNNGEPRDPRHQGDRGVFMCFEEATGRFLWQLVVPKIKTSMYWDWPNAGICSPASVEGDRVYLVSNRGEVMCLDVHGQANGNDGPYLDEARHCVPPGAEPVPPGPADADILWLFDLVKELGVRQHDSAHGSPLVETLRGIGDHQAGRSVGSGNPFGGSAVMRKIGATLARAAGIDLPVLLLGETGTGKELAARYVHEAGPRKERPFVPVNCGALPSELADSMLFGHERGAFTGASAPHRGRPGAAYPAPPRRPARFARPAITTAATLWSASVNWKPHLPPIPMMPAAGVCWPRPMPPWGGWMMRPWPIAGRWACRRASSPPRCTASP